MYDLNKFATSVEVKITYSEITGIFAKISNKNSHCKG